MSLAFIRIIGGIAFLDFYFQNKNNRFLQLTIGFFLFAVSPAVQSFFPVLEEIIADPMLISEEMKFIFILGEVIMSIGIYILVTIFISYSTTISNKSKILGLTPVIILPIILYPILLFEITFYLTQAIVLVLILGVAVFIFKHREEIQQIAKNSSIFFLGTIVVAVTNIILVLPIFGSIEFFVTLELLTRIGVSLMVPLIFVHFEYNLLSVEKSTLKDQYSHDLAQFVQTANARVYLISNNDKIDEKTKETLKDIESDHMKIGELIKRIREI
jgi:hypothetical protein